MTASDRDQLIRFVLQRAAIALTRFERIDSIQAIVGAWVASRFVYSQGVDASEVSFFFFLQSLLSNESPREAVLLDQLHVHLADSSTASPAPGVFGLACGVRKVASTTTVDPSLVDTFGRRHSYLRVSLTDRCNLKCRYCMPEDGEDPRVEAVAAAFRPSGCQKGEAHRRRANHARRLRTDHAGRLHVSGSSRETWNLEAFVGSRNEAVCAYKNSCLQDIGELNACLPEPLSLGITTNGVRLKKFLPQMRAAGLRNVNLSLDTLQAAKFPFLAGKPLDWHARIMDSMHADLTESLPVEVRFLEFMPFDGNAWSANRLVPQADMIESIQNHLESRGLPAASRAWCGNLWCYVDPELCPENEDLCEAAGGAMGSNASAHCRTRKTNPTNFLNVSARYSYETCGFINRYDMSALQDPVKGRTLRAAAAAWAPWVVSRTNLRNELEYGGPSYDFLEEALTLFTPAPTVEIIPGWATQLSRSVFPESSYTACVHDVAVGNFDICIADLWLTPQRNQLVTFLPAVRQDFFYLVVAKVQTSQQITLVDGLSYPFRPFTPGAWAGIVAILCIMSLLFWFEQLYETGCHGDYKTLLRSNVVAILRSYFEVWHDFLLQQSSMNVSTRPVRQIFGLGLAFFILITLASYTANLASLLVVSSASAGTVNSIEDAIHANMDICVDIEHAARNFHAGNCQAMVLSEDVINSLFAGKVRDADCQVPESEGFCGDPLRDCNFIRVGGLLWSVPLSFPINERMAHSLSWAFTAAITRGVFEDMKKINSELFHESICPEESSGRSLTVWMT
eukprot:s4361_g9.t1